MVEWEFSKPDKSWLPFKKNYEEFGREIVSMGSWGCCIFPRSNRNFDVETDAHVSSRVKRARVRPDLSATCPWYEERDVEEQEQGWGTDFSKLSEQKGWLKTTLG